MIQETPLNPRALHLPTPRRALKMPGNQELTTAEEVGEVIGASIPTLGIEQFCVPCKNEAGRRLSFRVSSLPLIHLIYSVLVRLIG